MWDNVKWKYLKTEISLKGVENYEKDEHDFSFFDEVIKKAKAQDIKVMMCIPTATIPSWLYQEDKEIIAQSIAQVKANEYAQRYVNRLSGGQRQRAYIAMALAQNTDIIFLDEPTTYLDINIRFEIMELIRALNEAGKTIIMVLHDLNLALEYSDHIILMNHGRIVNEGAPQQIITSGDIDRIFDILRQPKGNQQDKLILRIDEIRKYFPSGYSALQMSHEIFRLLEDHRSRTIRQRDRDER